MGLDLTYDKDSKKFLAVARCGDYLKEKQKCEYTNDKGEKCSYDSDAWNEMESEECYEICKRCPLECETEYWHTNNLFGCHTRAGGYTYVASLYNFFEEKALPQNRFTQLIKGGGFDLVKAEDIPELMEDIKKTIVILEGLKTEAGVPYKNGKKVDDGVRSAEEVHRYGIYTYFLASKLNDFGSSFCVGVHYKKGIALIQNSDPGKNIASILWGDKSATPSGDVTYFKETTDDRIRWAFCPFAFSQKKKEEWPDVVKFEPVDAMLQFGFLVKSFERICEKAAKFKIGIIGC